MRQSTLSWRGHIRAAALLSLSGLVIAACSATSDEPAPLYTMGTISPVLRQTVSLAPVEREIMAPVVLAPSMQPKTARADQAVDVIPLDDPSPQPAPARAALPDRALIAAAPMAAAPPPALQPRIAALPPVPPPAATPTPMATLAPSPETAASRPSATPAIASARPESPAASIRAEAVPKPISAEPPRAEPARAAPLRADIATSGLLVSVKDDRAARSPPRYYDWR